MTQAKSIYKQFYQKLILATSLFIIILSFIFYGYTKSTIYEELKESLLSDAELIFKISQNADANSKNFNIITHKGINVDMVTLKHFPEIPYTTFKVEDDHFMQILYPFNKDKKQYIKIVKNINSSIQMLTKIFNNILLISFGD